MIFFFILILRVIIKKMIKFGRLINYYLYRKLVIFEFENKKGF